MGFYYISILSVIPLGIAWGILALIFWWIARSTRSIRGRGLVLSIVSVVFFLLPISEELWIAWNFGQACKEAGTFINKKVEVDGFYDDTMGSAYENTKPGKYRFVEQVTKDRNGVERVERADGEARAKALAWYSSLNPGKSFPASVIYPVDDKVKIAVILTMPDAWRVTKLDRPMARYHFKSLSHIPHGHKVVKHDDIVTDSETKVVLGQDLRFGRYAPWFFVGLDAPVKLCYGKRDVKGMLYENVLLPKGKSGSS